MATATEEVHQEQFLSRLTSLPIVTSAIGQATNMYERTKECNDILKYTLETAEAGVKTVVDTAKPMVDKVDIPAVNKLNSVACEQLGKLEQSYPIIAQSPEHLYQQTKQLYDAKVQPTVDQVPEKVKSYTNDSIQGVIDYTTSTINGAKYYTTEVVEGVKEVTQEASQNAKRLSTYALQGVTNYTINKMDNVKNSTTSTIGSIRDVTMKTTKEVQEVTKGAVNRVKTMNLSELYDYTSAAVAMVLNSKIVSERLDGMLHSTETMVDYYMPDEHEEKESDLACKKEFETAARIAKLSNKARRILYARAMVQLHQAQLRSKEALGKLNHTVDLIEYARTNIDGATGKMKCRLVSAGDKMSYYWHEINRPEVEYIEMKTITENDEGVQEETKDGLEVASETFEKRMLASTRGLVLQLKRGIHLISTHLPILPPTIKDQVTNARDFTDRLYSEMTTATSFKDLPERLLQQTKESLGHVQHTLTLVGHHVISSWGISWLTSIAPAGDNAMENAETTEQEATQADERQKSCADEGPAVSDK